MLICIMCFIVRAAKFIANKEWIVCGADDGFIRVYNYNTVLWKLL